MYLKRIETVGFKSFADKINIEFHEGVTAVVGPNGSGKSNILDAIRWVLGEQSVKQLRGASSMTDVIFMGSATRKPLNYASVSLILDNQDHYLPVDYSEVSITRRVYRSGESEYLLNNETCRLKDITDLIMDTGLGRESFSIISQGRVQEILAAKAEDRRVIFEEAAGVLKYRKRKESAIKKLDKTDENLVQVSNIINELERQIEPLRKQSEQAKIFLEKKGELENIEIAVIARDIEELKENFDAAEQTIKELETLTLDVTTGINISESTVEEDKSKMSALDKEIQFLQEQLLEATTQVEKITGQKQLVLERRKYAKDNKDRFLESAMSLRENQLQIQNKISQLQYEIIDKNNERNEVKTNISKLDETIVELKQKRSSLEEKQNQSIREKEGLKSRLNHLYNSTENHSNFVNGVRSVLNNKKLDGIINVIGNLIEVEEQYTLAIETALGNAVQFIVCEKEIDARNAVNYLKTEKLGRATFFPIDVVRSRSVDTDYLKKAKSHDAYIATSDELAKYDEMYAGVIENQLGNVIVAKDLVGANEISKLIDHKYKIVTLEGEVVHIGGSITGGNNARHSTTIIREKQEIETIKKQLKKLDDTYALNEQLIQEYGTELKNLDSKIYNERIVLIQMDELTSSKTSNLQLLKASLEKVELELNNVENIINETSEEAEEMQLMKEQYDAEAKRDSLTREIATKRSQRLKIHENLEELDREIREANRILRDYQAKLKQTEIKKTRMDMELDTLLRRLSEEYSMTYEYAKEEFHLELEIEEARARVKVLRDAIKALGYVNVSAIDEFEAVFERFEFLTKQREDLIEAKKTLLETINEMDKVMIEKFSDSFFKIQTEFNLVFRHMFGGGKAELRLTDPENILETGIEIIAQPPGKTLQHLSLFSGGEKALTAISLLFAILRVRPVPFCVLDEVEAALDEANVARYAEYLVDFSHKTQFIVITHRKGTMEKADVLYGVTMQESGVSKLVSVHLEEVNAYMDKPEKENQR